MELRPQILTACSCSLPAAVDTSYNLLPLQEDLISGLKGSRIMLYPISVCLCELTMASSDMTAYSSNSSLKGMNWKSLE